MTLTQPPHTLDIDTVAADLEVNPAHGLNTDEASARAGVYGLNTIEASARTSFARKFLNQFRDLMIVILLLAAGLAGVMGEIHDTIVILVIVILNAIVGSVQEFRAERAIDALRRMTTPAISVRRNGHLHRIDTEHLVPGDIVYLEAGNIVPGDLRLFELVDFEVDEAPLTGESLAIRKTIEPIPDADIIPGDRYNMAFKGTNVTRGHAMGITVATGFQTELGRIATLLTESEQHLTPLQVRLGRFSRRLALAISTVAAIVFVSGLMRGEELILMLLTSVSLAVAAIPEALPAVISISLAIGANKMSRHDAVMRRLSAVETLGSVTYICSDKTGTLTLNEMRLAVIDADGKEVESLSESGDGDEPWRLLGLGMALCSNVVRGEGQQVTGDPTEIALYLGALEAGFDKTELESRYPRLAELPFHADRRIMSTLNRLDDAVVVFSKGAPESMLPRCRAQLTSDGEREIDTDALLQKSHSLAQQGYRMLALAIKRYHELPTNLSSEAVETELVLLGLVGLIDPPRDEVYQSIVECNNAGITPVMITGDHPGTALAIASKLGISTDNGVLTGEDLDQIPFEDFLDRVQDIHVYARVSPEQKIKIVSALQRCGEYVAMTGDGVNDAPALKQANIGVSMGLKGTDVARESSDMVLKDDNFATIVRAVREGRRIFDNIRKFIKYTMTSNAGEIWVIFLAPFVGLPLPLLPIQILWINLVTDGLPGLALSAEPHEKGIMRRPPRQPEESIFAHGMWQHVIWVGLLIGGISLGAQAWAYHGGSENWQTMVFTVLTLCQLAHAMVIRFERESLFSQGIFSNLPLLGTVLLTIGLQMLVVYVPLLNQIFHTTPLTAHELGLCFLLPLIVLFAVETEKWLARTGKIYRTPIEHGSKATD
ncbi:MAG: cation-translocating P-type ATPase [Gammaproteobacteria bacterium]|nr:MAG: cation-translocating P-type ATPase [Gammaproteobacteria bacterium]